MQTKFILDRYFLHNKIGNGRLSEIYLASDKNNKNKKVAIKILKSENISNRIDDIIRFQRESEIISSLTHPNIICLYDVDEKDDLHYIVMEYFKGKSLSYYLENNLIADLDLIIEIVINLCVALYHIHNKNIIHRDLNPGNILVLIDENSLILKELKLIDFGLSQLKKMKVLDINEMVGTLSYISPEQTGILRKHVDERSDLYSLGILFYQMLAKRLPFIADNISSIIHQQIAKKPESLRNIDKNIPEIIEKMIFKLLEKEQDDRYQSAEGLLKDLIKYKQGLTDFIIGLDDKVLKLHYRTKLVGREKEFEILRSGFESMLNKKGSIYFIKGEAGIGKSRLVEEFKDYVLSRGRVVIDGKGFAGKNKIPYGPFKDALNVYIKNFIYYTDVEKQAVKKALKEEFKGLGRIILNLNPRMKEVIGSYPPLVKLEVEHEHKRFITYISRFLLKLSEMENGLILYLDDLQWFDEGSYEILSRMSYEISNYPLMIIGTYRDNEISEDSTLISFRDTCMKNKIPLHEISIDYFDKQSMDNFISSILFDRKENIRDISEYILQKSRGNPFFAIEILKDMVSEKAIIQYKDKWNISQEILNKMEIFTSIVDILLKRISLLEKREINILSNASVIGRKFNIELLLELYAEESKGEGIRVVEKAIELQLLEEDNEVKGNILFVHDRIREAFYQNIRGDKKKDLHNIIGNVIEKKNKNREDENIFNLAYHFIEAGNEDKIIKYAYPAGIKAKENYANIEAIKYLNIVREIYEKKGLIGSKDWLKIGEELSEAYLLAGKKDEGIALCEKLLLYKNTYIGRARIYRNMAYAFYKKGDFKECEYIIKKGLELLGVNLPIKKNQIIIDTIKQLIIHMFYGLFHGFFENTKRDKINPEYKEILSLKQPLCVVYLFSDYYKLPFTVLYSLHISSFKIGFSEELGFSLMFYAIICMSIPLKKRAKKYFLKAIKIFKELKCDFRLAQSIQCYGIYYTINRSNYQKSTELLKEALLILSQIGDIWISSHCYNGLGFASHYLGDYKNSIFYFNEYFKISKINKDNYGLSASMAGISWNYIEMNEFDKAIHWLDQSLELSELNKIWLPNCYANIYYGVLEIERGNYKESIKYLEKAKKIYENNNLLKDYTVLVYPFLTEAYLECYNSKKNIKKNENIIFLKKIEKNLSKAKHHTYNWKNNYCITLRILAKYYKFKQHPVKANKYYLKSIELSKKINRKYELAKTYFEYGKFLKSNNKEKDSIEQWKKAYSIFEEIGSKHYIKKINGLLNIEEKKESPVVELIKRVKKEQLSSNLLDMIHDIISSEDIYKIIDKIMNITLEMTNASRGCIILRDKKTDVLEVLISKSTNKEEISIENYSLSIIYEVLNTGELVITNNALNDRKFSMFQSIIKYGVNSILCFPIVYKGNIKGVCYFDNILTGFNFTKDNIEKINLLMTHLVLSIENTSYKISNKILEIDENYLNQKVQEFGITKREKEIILMVIRGFTNKEISNNKSIFLSTLRTHMNNIYKKTQLNNRDELIKTFSKIKVN